MMALACWPEAPDAIMRAHLRARPQVNLKVLGLWSAEAFA
jgi:hypothetical protein